MAVDWSQFKPVSGPVDWSQFKPYEEKKEGAFARAGRIARDEDGGVLAAAGSLIEAALPDSRAGRDTTVAALKSAVGVPQSAIGLIDIASGGRFGRALEQAGIDPNAAQRALDELYSPETQAAKREVQAAEGFTDTAGAMLRNPSTILTGIGESIAPMLAGGVVGRGAAALSSRLSPAAAAAIGEGALMAGQSASQIRGQTEDGLLTPTQSALAAGTGVVGGIIGRAGGALSNKVGIGDVDTAIVQGALTESAKRPGFLARTALGAGIEGGVEEMPQSIVEQAAQNVALGKPWDEGLGSAAAQGLVVGAPFGAVGANLSRPAAAPEPAPAADPLDAQADRFRAATDAYLKDKPGADTIADVVSQPTVDAAIDALGAASPSMDEILAGKRQRAAQRVAEELGFADQVDARSPEQIMADAAARREQAALAAQQELGLSPTSAGAAPDPRTAEQIVADFEARRQAAVEQLQGAPAGQAPRTEQDFAARRREAALAAISDMGESLPRFRYTPSLQGNKQEVASTEPDLVGTYVQQMRETNTPAARAFVQLYESGRITDQDVSDTIARQNPQLQAPAEPAIPSNATPLQAEGIQIEQMRRRAAPTLDLKQPEQAVAERAQAQRAEGDATPELTQQRLEAAAAQGRQQDPMTPVQVGQYIDALRLENTPQARALVQEYEAGRVTDQDVADAVNAQRRYQLGGVDLAQNRIETAATRGAQQAPGLQVERSGARAPNAALAEAVQMYGDMPLTARDMTVEGASERLSRAAAQARQTPESLIQVGDTTQTSRVPFRGRNEAIRTSNEGLDAAAAGRGGERMTAPRPTLIGGKPPGSYTDQQLRDLVGNDVVPAITRRGAETELAVRALQQRAQAPAAPAAPGTTSPGGIILASAKRSPQDVLSSVARSRESKVGRPVQMTVVDTNTLPAQRGAGAGALSRQAHTIINNVSRVFGKKLVVFESDDATAPDGFYSRDDPDTIYLNRNSETPHLVVFGHELLHSLRKDNEAAYQALVKTIKLKEGADISETPGIRGDIEEFTADLMGNQFRDNEFWVATFRDIIASKGEQQGRQVVTRLAAAAVRAVNGLMKALGRAPGYNTDEMVANLGEVKTALRSALSTYAKDRYGAAVAMERERVAAAPAPAPAAAAAPATTVAPTATKDAQASEKRVEGPFKPARTMSELEDVLASEKRGEGELRTKLNKDGSLTVYGDPDQVRALLPEGIVGRNVQGGVSFTASQAPRVRAAVEGRRVAYSRQGEVTEKLPMRDGKYIGAPEKYNTPAKISTLRRNLRQLTMEGQEGRYWYENSSREVLAMVGGNVQEARKFVALLSIYSPQAKVDANSTFALRAWAQYKAGQPISVKTGVQDRKATAALQDVDAFWSGEKTGNFFFNLLREIDPSTAGKQGATIDMWMMRAAEYSSDAPTSTQYAFMENETNRIAREMGWEPQQVQAAIWVAMKARMENAGVKKRTEASSEKKGWIRYDYPIKNGRPTKTRVILDAQKHRDNWLKHAFQHDPTKSDTQGAKFDFSDGLRRHIGQLSWEARPGRTTGVLPGVNDAPYEQQVEFQQAVQKALLDDDDGIDLLAYKLGLLVDGPDILAPGVWQGEIAAGMQKQVGMAPAKGDAGKTSIDPAQALAMDAYASVLGMLLRQEGVGYHRPFYKGNRASENAVNLSIGRTFTPAEAQALWSEVDRRMRAAGVADWENGAGLISSPDGMRVVNFGAVGDNLAFQSMVASAAEALPVESVELQRFSTDGNLVMNNWVENPNGEGYRSRVSETYGPDLLDWAGTVLAPRVQSVFDEFSSRYGWGDAGDVAALFPAGQRPAAEVKASEKRQTNTPEFKRWFGDSKVVDENGQPLVVYHGSKWSSITSFDFKPRGFADLTSEPSARMPGWEEVRGTYTRDGKRHLIAEWMSAGGKVLVKYAGGMEILDTRGRSPTAVVFSFMNPREPISDRVAAGHRAAFFSENPEYTGFYSMWGARDGEDAPTTYPVYLRIENPVLPKHWATFEPFYREATKGDQAKLDLAKQAFMNERWEAKEAYPGFIEYAISKGFDGYANVEGGASAFAVSPVTEMAPGGVRTWAVFRPTQVKSAIGNRGAFDLTNPDIRASEKRQTNTPEFKRWFGDSKVVDENGEPLVVYHGTLGDFDEFDLAQFGKGDDGVAGRAFYFSNFTSVASDYAMTPPRGRPDGANVMPVYLSAKNPLVWDYFSSEGKELQRLREQFGPDGFAKWAQQRGYDSVKIIGNLDGEENAVQWAVFRPEQIKSAIGNRGTFDPANADIRASEKRQVNTPEFKRWFGDSKVVDENGNPLVVYTGTSKDVDFTKFKVPKNGVWFTTDPQEASMYAMDNDSKDLKYNPDTRRYDEVNTASRVMPTFLRIENPATLSEADSQAMRFASNYRKAQGLIFDRLRAQGYDGVDMGDGVWVVIGQPAQIKSAIGNRGTFDPANADIRASDKRNIFNQRIQPAWSVAPDTKLDAFLYKLQDKQIDLKRITQAIKDAIGGLAEKWDAYLAEELYHGRTAKQTKDFLQDEMKPLVDAMTANRVTMPELEEYLHNRHAEERNRQIATINPNLPDAGSGIATADARRYLAGLPANQRQRYEALARQVDAINKKTRQLLVSSGLEKQDTIDAWERTYPTYMPLFREDADYDGSQSPGGTGMGFSVRGPSSKRATGSADREVVDILANVALMRERTITRAEKARVGRALYGLAVQNPNPGFWLAIDPKTPKDIPGAVNTLISMGMTAQDARNLMQQPTVPYVDPRTGLVTYRVNPLLRNAEHVMSVRVDGEDKMLVFNPRDERAQRMVTSLKNLDAQQLGGALSAAAFVSRWFAQVNTQYNPVFGAINLIRDVGGAAFNLTTTDIADRKAQVMAGVGPALVGIYQDLRKNRTGQRSQGQWAQLWEEFQREGGQTGFRDMFSRSDERAVALQRMLDPSSWAESPLGKFFTANGTLKAPMEVVRKGAAPVFNWLSDYNETLENAVRLSAYKAAKDKGLSNAKAASIAKNLTVNFNRKGQVGVQMGALYAFFNASVQGTARLAETLGSGRDPNASAYSPNRYMGKTGQRIIAGGLLLGVMQAVALAMAGFDEDEPPEFIKERNLVIPLDWVDNLGGPDLDGKYLTIPMPLGLNVIPNTGRVLTEWWMSGFKDTPKRVASITGSFLEMFNPIGNAGWSVQTIAPTFADPLVALSENRDWTGKPIAKEDRSGTDPTPGYTRAKDTASIISKGIAYALNAVSGGTDYKPGVVSPTPDQIDYLIGQVTGGVGREVLKVSQAVESGVTGEDLPTYKIPVAGRFYGDTKELSAVSSRYYDNLTRMNQHENEIKGRAADRVPIGDYFEDNPEARLVFLSNRIEREVSDLRRRKRELIKREASKESIKMAEEAIRRRMQSLNDAIERAQKRTPNNGLNP